MPGLSHQLLYPGANRSISHTLHDPFFFFFFVGGSTRIVAEIETRLFARPGMLGRCQFFIFIGSYFSLFVELANLIISMREDLSAILGGSM